MPNTILPTVLCHLRQLLGKGEAHGVTDGQLLERFIAHREEAAFAALMQRHGSMVLGVCRRLLEAHDAEDVFQATFLVLVKKAMSIRKQQSVGSWLHGVAYRLASKARGQAVQRRTHEQKAGDMRTTEVPPEIAWRELQQILDEELQRLPERYRLPLVHCYLEEQTHEESAAALGLPVGTVKSRLARGKEQLRKGLAKRGLTLSVPALTTTLAVSGTALASVPSLLAQTTAQAASLVGAGQVLAGVVSSKVLALMEGAVSAMAVSKMKIGIFALVLFGLLAGGGGVTWNVWGNEASENQANDSNQLTIEPKEKVPLNPDARVDLKKMQGSWKLVRKEIGGRLQEDIGFTDRLDIEGNRLLWKHLFNKFAKVENLKVSVGTLTGQPLAEKGRRELLNLLAPTRDPRVGLLLAETLHDKDLGIRSDAWNHLLKYYLPVGVMGGSEQHFSAAVNFAKLNGPAWKKLAKGLPDQAVPLQEVDLEVISGTLELDPSKDPKRLTILGTQASYLSEKKAIIPALYQIEGDTLTILWDYQGKDMPGEFKTHKGSSQNLLVFEREKPAKPVPDAEAGEKEKLQGLWTAVGLNINGKPKLDRFETGVPSWLFFEGDSATFLSGNLGEPRPFAYQDKAGIRLHLEKKQLDFIFSATGPKKDQKGTLKCKYTLNEDDLIITIGTFQPDPPAKALELKNEDNRTETWIFKRQKQDKPVDQAWHALAKTNLVAVHVERCLYQVKGEKRFLMAVKLTNLTKAEIGVDWQEPRPRIYGNQWGVQESMQREVVDERRTIHKAPDLNKVRAEFNAGRLTRIPAGQSAIFWAEFNSSGRAEVDASKGKYLIISMDGQFCATDGKTVDTISCEWKKPVRQENTDVVMPFPVTWKTKEPNPPQAFKGLRATIDAAPEVSAFDQQLFVRLFLVNDSDKPMRIATDCYRNEQKLDDGHILLNRFPNLPDEKNEVGQKISALNIVTLKPGQKHQMETTIPYEQFTLRDSLTVSIGYYVADAKFIAKHNVWSGEIRTKPVTIRIKPPVDPKAEAALPAQWTEKIRFDWPEVRIVHAVLSADGTTLAANGEAHKTGKCGIRVWNTRTGKTLSTLWKSPWERVGLLGISPNGQTVAATGGGGFVNNHLILLDVASAVPGKDIVDKVGGGWGPLVFAPNGELAVVAKGPKKSIILWDRDGKERKTIEGMNPEQIVFSSDGKVLATRAWGRDWTFFDATTGEPLPQLAQKPGKLASKAISPWDSKAAEIEKIADAVFLNVFEVSTGKKLFRVSATEKEKGFFSPNDALLACVHFKYIDLDTRKPHTTLILRSAATGQKRATFELPGQVFAGFSSDNQGFLTVNLTEGIIRLWEPAK